MNELKIRAYAKLNLYLDITGKRPDGYHELKTVMQTIDLYDELEFTLSEGSGIEILCDKQGVPTDENNLIYDGIMSVISYAYFQPGCKITVRLKKNIPSQAGMGGGSSDCAAAIAAMNKLFRLEMSADEMRECGKMCGADVPFLICGGTALCEGIGEKITQLEPVNDMYIAVIKPSEAISTPQAYKLFDEKGTENAGDYKKIEKALKDNVQLGRNLYNAFTDSCAIKAVDDAIEILDICGAYGAEMTGSGSAVFGIFDSKEKAEKAVERASTPFGGVYVPVNCGNTIIK